MSQDTHVYAKFDRDGPSCEPLEDYSAWPEERKRDWRTVSVGPRNTNVPAFHGIIYNQTEYESSTPRTTNEAIDSSMVIPVEMVR